MKYRALAINLPPQITTQLTYTQAMILDLLAEMTVRTTPHGHLVYKPTTFTQYWLAKRLNRTREWISKSLRALERNQLITIIRRRITSGKYATNLYMLSKRILRIWSLWARSKIKRLHHVNYTPHRVDLSSLILEYNIGTKPPLASKDPPPEPTKTQKQILDQLPKDVLQTLIEFDKKYMKGELLGHALGY